MTWGRSILLGLVAVVIGVSWLGFQSTTSHPTERTGAAQTFMLSRNMAARYGALAVGPDGNLWSTEVINPALARAGETSHYSRAIVRITPDGKVTRFRRGLAPDGSPFGITAGPDGAMWFVDGTHLGRITMAGGISEFDIGEDVTSVAAGADGNVWFLVENGVGRIDPSGAGATFFRDGLPQNPYLQRLTPGPRGHLWFRVSGRVGEITPAGKITVQPLRRYDETDLAAGRDGDVWFLSTRNGITHMTPDGKVHRFGPAPTVGGNAGTYDASGTAPGPDGNLWIAAGDGRFMRMSADGEVTEYQGVGGQPTGIISGPDRKMWSVDADAPLLYAVAVG
jgi:virginiamycin B lyase